MTDLASISVLCVDDNPDVAAGMRMLIESDPSMRCVGCLGSADGFVEFMQGQHPAPDVVLLDATMPGSDPFVIMQELAGSRPGTRTIIFSGHDDPAFVERAIDAGAWGCVSKHDEPTAILQAVREVAAGHVLAPRR